MSALVILGGLQTKAVGDIAAIAGGLPTFHLRHLSPGCRQLLGKANFIIDVNILQDPLYTVAGANVMY